jgi:hypothetical protein
VILIDHRKIFVVGIRWMAMGGPQDADKEKDWKQENDEDRAGSLSHSRSFPASFCARVSLVAKNPAPDTFLK